MADSNSSNQAKNKHLQLPAFMKDKWFQFIALTILFLFSFAVLLLIDENNVVRPSWFNFLTPLLKSWNLMFDVTMGVWFLFFMIFGVLYAVFFVVIFYSKFKNDQRIKIQRKKNRDPEKNEIVRFNVIFWCFVGIVLAVVFAVIIFYFNKQGYFDVIGKQLADAGKFVSNFFISFGLLLAAMLFIPLTFIVIFLILKLLVLIIVLLVGAVSRGVMQSQAYQENVAASQAAAQDIADTLRRAREQAGDAINAANSASAGGGSGSGQRSSNGGDNTQDILFPALTKIDANWDEKIAKEQEEKAQKELEETKRAEEIKLHPELASQYETVTNEDSNKRPPLDYEQFRILAYEFQSYLCHQKYYFPINVIRSFIAGLASARLILLEGLSGTGKSTLPRVFLEYIGGKAHFFPVQATWRDRSDITGYYSDFTGQFKETELLKHLYEASYYTENVNLMVLDEMNISRVEYYFADFLSIYEYPPEDWVVPLMQVRPGLNLPKFIEEGKVRIPANTWFVGTVNIDDSTFTIADKVYDRSIVIDFKSLNLPFDSSYRFDKHTISYEEMMNMFSLCKEKPENQLTGNDRKKFMDLCSFMGETFDVQFGNRIMNQIDNFLPVFVGLGGTKNEALDIMFARKVLRKLDGRFESYIRDGLNKLTRYLNSLYGKHVFVETEEAIEKYRRKLS